MKWGEIIRRKREEKGLSRRELGEKIGISEQGLGDWERGDVPDIKTVQAGRLIKACEVLDIEPGELPNFAVPPALRSAEPSAAEAAPPVYRPPEAAKLSAQALVVALAYDNLAQRRRSIIDLMLDEWQSSDRETERSIETMRRQFDAKQQK